MKDISIKGIVVGAVVYMVAIIPTSFVLYLYAAFGRKLPVEKLYTDTGNLLGCVFFSIVCAIIGGYVTGKIAKNRPYANALALGIILLVIGIIFPFTGKPYPLWFILAGDITHFPAIFFGAYLSKTKVASALDLYGVKLRRRATSMPRGLMFIIALHFYYAVTDIARAVVFPSKKHSSMAFNGILIAVFITWCLTQRVDWARKCLIMIGALLSSAWFVGMVTLYIPQYVQGELALPPLLQSIGGLVLSVWMIKYLNSLEIYKFFNETRTSSK